MKKKVLSALVMATVAICSYAQGYAGTTFNDRIGHGQDSLDVINQFSLYREEFKNKNYEEAYNCWKVVMEKAPLSQIRIYQDGDIICQELLKKETDAAKKQEIFNTMMDMHDTRIKLLDDLNSFATKLTTTTKGNILCRKAYDYFYYNPKPNYEEAYKLFQEGINDLGENVEAYILYGYIQCSYNRFQNKKDDQSREDFINDYMNCNDICERLLDEAKQYPAEVIPANPESEDSTEWEERVVLSPEAEKIIKNYQPTQDLCNDLFVKSGAADCDALTKIYEGKVEGAKQDLNQLNTILKILQNFECDKSELYYKAADYAYELNKTPSAALGKAAKLLKAGDSNGAMKYLQEAIELEDDPVKKGKTAFSIAQILYSKGNVSGCRQYCNTALRYIPSMGRAYLLIANCIVRSAPGASQDTDAMLTRSYYYCLATDKCLKAMSVDPSCAGRANSQIASYKNGYYPKSEAFFKGLKAGQSVSVMGETTTLRLR
jgi:tetratricopeptide (TPR) repeat protein